ncbi:MAG: FAD-dependent monooxygenase [Chloroflexaceae bacterium]|nr:FAD-dependent monooxygenase [Chloroflexaceae bacterium]
MTRVYDVIIVGARLAGAATAALLARQGARVLLLERTTFPSPIVSCPIFFGDSLVLLDHIGVLGDVETIGAPRIRRYGLRSPRFDVVAELPPAYGYDYAYSIRREVLDTVILRSIANQNAIEVREGFTVTDLIQANGRVVGVRGRSGGGAEESLYAYGVIGADGKRSLVARAVGSSIYASMSVGTCFFYAYYRDFAPLDEPSAVVYTEDEWNKGVLVIDADDDLTLVSMAADQQQFEQIRKDPEAALEAAWRAMPELRQRGEQATRVTPVMGEHAWDSFYRQSYGPGWALVGDAGHTIDPFTSKGIRNALRSAEILAQAWQQTRRRDSWVDAMARYQWQRDTETMPMFQFLEMTMLVQEMARMGFDLGSLVMRALARRPEMAQYYVGIYNGATPVETFLDPFTIMSLIAEDVLCYELPDKVAELFSRMTTLRSSPVASEPI